MKILLIRLRSIGDVVFSTPALAALRQRFPAASITYLVERDAEPVVRHNPHLDEVIVAARPRGVRRLAYDARLAWRLRQQRFDVVLDFHGGPRSAWLTFATGAPRRIGYAAPGRAWAYTTKLPWTRSLVPPRHSVQNQWDLLAPLGIDPSAPGATPVEMPPDSRAAESVERRLRAAGVPDQALLIVMHVSAGNPFRRWPAEHFASVAAALATEEPSSGAYQQNYDHLPRARGAVSGPFLRNGPVVLSTVHPTRRIIISSGPSESDAADAIASRAQTLAGEAADAIVRCGEFDLSELRALIGRAALYIGGDSGPLHIAATTQVPIVALFGPTLPERSMPWRDEGSRAIAIDAGELPCRPCHQRQCVPGDFRCLTTIDPERVISAAELLLDVENSRP